MVRPAHKFSDLAADEFIDIPNFATIMQGGTLTKSTDLPVFLRFARIASMSFMILFIVFAFIIMVATAVIKSTFAGDLLPSAALGANLMLSATLGLVSIYALVGVKQRQRSITVMSAIILSAIIVAQIVIPVSWVVMQPNADEMDMPIGGVLYHVENLLAMSWSMSPNSTKASIQHNLGCCGAFNWPQNCYSNDEHSVGTPANHYNMPPSLTTTCDDPKKTPRECCINAGYAIITLNETACLGGEIIAQCCQPPCTTECGKHQLGCIDVMLEKMYSYRVALIVIASLFAFFEILGVVFLFWYHVASVRFEMARSGDVLQRQHERRHGEDRLNVDGNEQELDPLGSDDDDR